ncbi:LOW QUALITY PROTEIN: hypothetical protein YC2023_058114 [Brassica napus]
MEMDAEKKSTHFRQISTYKPELVLSSIQEHSSSKISNKPTIKSTASDVDSDIGVFGAEKYFSMKLDHDITNQKEKENIQDDLHPQMTKNTSTRSRTSRQGTPSVRSESSYNTYQQTKTPFRSQKSRLSRAKRSDIAMNLERKLSMHSWDAIPNHISTKNNNGNNSSMSSKTLEEETASEASSDLFEIENITSSVYEPSEASIGWSVVTGSMADQSVISDFDMMKRGTRSGSVVKAKPMIAEKVRSGGLLSGCKSHKAVSVLDSTKILKETSKVDHHEMSQKKKFKTEIRIQDLSFL